ncbi:MAG TPA: hypothetical protein VFW38_03885 [Solirubrobacteraceae bacterium]|nr:hypothetical protein [Solirubrobacteraceae bacterium]
MDYGSANPHLNVFEPYRELGRSHEDQLTRAAMIVLRLVPLAREALLQAIGEPSQSRLPDCVIDMQATNLVDPSEESAAGGEVERQRLVSVFLTPDTEPVDISPEITEIDRGQRFDGVLRFDPELVVVLESKVCRRWARRDGKRVAELNLGGTHFEHSRTCVLHWHDLLEAWWRLVELGVLAPAEQAIVGDVLAYAHQDFGQLLPYGTLRRVGADPVRRKWRLRSLLAEATGIVPERAGLVHIRLDTALGAVTLQRAALEADEEQLTLHIWPGELKAQAEQLYAGGRAERLCELIGADGGTWEVKPQPLLGFRNAPVRTRVYLTCDLDPGEYARRWQGADWKRVGAHHRNHVRDQLWPWLLDRHYAAPGDEERIEPFLRALGRRFAHLRPSMHVARTWDWAQAQQLDDEGLLAGEIHDALDRVLALLDEPPLAPSGESGAAIEQEAVQAVVAS